LIFAGFLNNASDRRPGLNNFLRADISLYHPTKGMPAEFKAPNGNILSYLFNIHQAYLLSNRGGDCNRQKIVK